MDEHSSTITNPFGGSFPMELTTKIMLASIFILFMVVLFVLILHLYSKWLLFHIHDSATDSAAVATLGKGLDAAVLRSIPVVAFSLEDFKEGLECAVCLSELTQGEKARLLPICNHGFHVDCIDMWFKSNSTCPLCRNNPLPPKSSNHEEFKDLESGSSPVFPTNVLFWGNQMHISSLGVCLEEAQTSSSASITPDGMVVVHVPNNPTSSSSGTDTGAGDEEMKSVVTNRLRTLKRLLSRERRIACNPNSLDLQQVGTGQS